MMMTVNVRALEALDLEHNNKLTRIGSDTARGESVLRVTLIESLVEQQQHQCPESGQTKIEDDVEDSDLDYSLDKEKETNH